MPGLKCQGCPRPFNGTEAAGGSTTPISLYPYIPIPVYPWTDALTSIIGIAPSLEECARLQSSICAQAGRQLVAHCTRQDRCGREGKGRIADLPSPCKHRATAEHPSRLNANPGAQTKCSVQSYLAGGTVRGFTLPQSELLKTAVASWVQPIAIVSVPRFWLATK